MAFNLLRRFYDKGGAISPKHPKSKTIKIYAIFLLYHLATTFNAGATAYLDATLKCRQGALQLLKVEDAIHELLLSVLDPLKIC
jgi:hypothetical protein